jgi:hypothetical protein
VRLLLHQPGTQSFALLYVIRAPSCVGTLGAMTSAPPVPLTIATEENIHAQSPLNPNSEFVQPTGTASFFHFILCDKLGDSLDLHVLR